MRSSPQINILSSLSDFLFSIQVAKKNFFPGSSKTTMNTGMSQIMSTILSNVGKKKCRITRLLFIKKKTIIAA